MPLSVEEFQVLIRQLPGLSDEQRRDVRLRCQRLGVDAAFHENAEPRAASEPLDWLLSAIRAAAVDKGFITNTTPIKTNKLYGRWLDDFAENEPLWLGQLGKPAGAKLAAFGRVFASCYLAWIEKSTRRPPTVRSILTYLNAMPSAIEDAFPGYQNSKMLGMLVKERE